MINVNAYLLVLLCTVLGALGGSLVTWLIVGSRQIYVTMLDDVDEEQLQRLHTIRPHRAHSGDAHDA